MSEEEFDVWINGAYASFRDSWRSTDEMCAPYRDRQCDLLNGTVTFYDDRVARLTADLQVIGTTGSDGDWLWAWANEAIPSQVTRDAEGIRHFGIQRGVELLIKPHWTSDRVDDLGWDMTVAAAHLAKAQGALTVPYGQDDRQMFMTLRNLRPLNPS